MKRNKKFSIEQDVKIVKGLILTLVIQFLILFVLNCITNNEVFLYISLVITSIITLFFVIIHLRTK